MTLDGMGTEQIAAQLEQVVLGEIKHLTKYAIRYEDEFLKAIMGSTQKTAESECKRKQKELSAARARDDELDGLFERIYEDNLSGKLSDERFSRMSQRYEAEQLELKERMKTLRTEIDKLASESVSTDMFLSIVRKYTRAKKLTPRMLNELVNHIEVHQAEKIDGEWVQKLTIHYNCVGALFIPDTEALPAPEVTVNTCRGVYVTGKGSCLWASEIDQLIPAEACMLPTSLLKMSSKKRVFP